MTYINILQVAKRRKKILLMEKLENIFTLHDFYPAVAPKNWCDIGTGNFSLKSEINALFLDKAILKIWLVQNS